MPGPTWRTGVIVVVSWKLTIWHVEQGRDEMYSPRKVQQMALALRARPIS